MRKFKGDTGKVRAALHEVMGYDYAQGAFLFNDKRKDGTRRIKVWMCANIVRGDLDTQHMVANALKEQFGDRLLEMYSLPAFTYYPSLTGQRSLCIELRN